MPIAKKYKAAIALFDREAQYTPTEAAELIKKTASAKFDESIDLAIRLGVDPRKADQAVRGTVALPAGSGKTLRIAVFAAGDAANEARAAGADLVGADDLAAEIEKGKRQHGLRPCHCNARHDATCWPSWSRAWTSGSYAKPKDRNSY